MEACMPAKNTAVYAKTPLQLQVRLSQDSLLAAINMTAISWVIGRKAHG